jgi:hypothetical protein
MSVRRKSGRERTQYSTYNPSGGSNRNTRVSGISRSTSGRVSLPPLYISGYQLGSYPKGHSSQFLSAPTRSVSPVSALDEDASVYSDYVSELDERVGGYSTRTPLKGRISTVSQYPVYSSRPTSVDVRGKVTGRPISIASTSSAGIFLAVGQLPGSELFEVASPTVTKFPYPSPGSNKVKEVRTETVVKNNSTVYNIAQTIRLQRVGSLESKQTTSNRISIVSTISHKETTTTTPPQIQGVSVNSGNPSPLTLQAANAKNAQFLIDGLGISGVSTYPPIATVNGRISRLPPPPPPPKDPGYINRRPALNNGRDRFVGPTEAIYQPRESSKRQNITPSEQRQRSGSRQTNTQKSFWKAMKQPRVGLLAFSAPNHTKMRSKARMRARKHRETSAEKGFGPSMLLDACARFFQRALPKLNFRKGSHTY